MSNESSPRPWTWDINDDDQLMLYDADGNPLGQLFDHGCESEATLIVAAVNERERLRDLVKRMIPFVEKCHSDALDLSKTIKGICALKGVDTSEIDRINSEHDALIAEARTAIGEDKK